MQPSSGVMCAGPQGAPLPKEVIFQNSELHCTDALLPLKLYDDESALLQHFERMDIYRAISECSEPAGFRLWEDILPVRMGSILLNNGRVLAEIPWNALSMNEVWQGAEGLRKRVLNNGWTRCALIL